MRRKTGTIAGLSLVAALVLTGADNCSGSGSSSGGNTHNASACASAKKAKAKHEQNLTNRRAEMKKAGVKNDRAGGIVLIKKNIADDQKKINKYC